MEKSNGELIATWRTPEEPYVFKLFRHPREEFAGIPTFNLVGIDDGGVRRVDEWWGPGLYAALDSHAIDCIMAGAPKRARLMVSRARKAQG